MAENVTSESVRTDVAARAETHRPLAAFGNILIDGINGIIRVGDDGDIIIDAGDKTISVGANSEIVIDATNKRITVGAANDIILDANNKQVLIGTGSEIILDATNKRFLAKDSGGNNKILVDAATGAFKIADVGGNVLTQAANDLAFYFDPSTGNLKIRGDLVNTSAQVLSHLTIEHWFTGVSTYEKLSGTYFKVNGDNFNNQQVFYEMNMLVEQSGRTAYTRLYNETAGAALSGSEITSTFVGNYDGGRGIYTTWQLVRSAALTFPSGEATFSVQVRQNPAGNGGDKAHFFAGRLVHTQA